ncbi:4-azaleucine resistance transporter AzlC [Caldalkalibacillus uzonensis]|uniref:4-azaleucine resistance transporter AzlC n=1 Tax=Caldalkalibacillus uzonensis TaxID=353224 RepID=A0ABU0CT59_9BACI|nr:AzlC family ABC transporter permease [Caldalkalibacillus uzonensis]MDQ0339594.1 4-azaleucine resistance transporter AzlC [Caldalkalibacillus uzonensis]
MKKSSPPSTDIYQRPSSAAEGFAQFIQGAKLAFPIVIGYIPIAISYGVIALESGLSLFHTVAMSVFIYAGASQFMAVNMLGLGAGALELIFATFVLNLRHFVMSLFLMHRLRHLPQRWRGILSYGITDESFAVASFKTESGEKDGSENNDYGFQGKDHLSSYMFLGLFLTAYLAWIGGTLLGGLFYMFIPPAIGASMAIALYAMFIGLLIPAIRRSLSAGVIAVISAIFCTLFTVGLELPSGWGIVLATLMASLAGIVLFRGKEGQ